jgi:hypothetical protein
MLPMDGAVDAVMENNYLCSQLQNRWHASRRRPLMCTYYGYNFLPMPLVYPSYKLVI